MTKRLQSAYFDVVYGRDKKYRSDLTFINRDTYVKEAK